jgi:hypothetical protein
VRAALGASTGEALGSLKGETVEPGTYPLLYDPLVSPTKLFMQEMYGVIGKHRKDCQKKG